MNKNIAAIAIAICVLLSCGEDRHAETRAPRGMFASKRFDPNGAGTLTYPAPRWSAVVKDGIDYVWVDVDPATFPLLREGWQLDEWGVWHDTLNPMPESTGGK